MKREIKFKAKTVTTRTWVYGDLIQYPEGTADIHGVDIFINGDDHIQMTEVDPETVCQFTGLKDMNGVEVYEGDVVVRRNLTYGTEKTCKVVYNSEIACFRLHQTDKVFTWRYGFISSDTYNDGKCKIDIKYEYEVVGNIHDNFDLMK